MGPGHCCHNLDALVRNIGLGRSLFGSVRRLTARAELALASISTATHASVSSGRCLGAPQARCVIFTSRGLSWQQGRLVVRLYSLHNILRCQPPYRAPFVVLLISLSLQDVLLHLRLASCLCLFFQRAPYSSVRIESSSPCRGTLADCPRGFRIQHICLIRPAAQQGHWDGPMIQLRFF